MHMPDFNRVNPSPMTGSLKQQPDDFIVKEQLAYEPCGHGEHAFVLIEKRNQNTLQVVNFISILAGVKQRQVSYAGLKDRYAVTQQWFSVQLPGQVDPDWSKLEKDDLRVLRSTRHDRKLRHGHIASNHFRILMRDYTGNENSLQEFEQRINTQGVPNYFTEQRFGHNGSNLQHALEMINVKSSGRLSQKQGMYLSAARALLFNLVLSERIGQQNWNQALDGEVYCKSGSRVMFTISSLDQETCDRVAALEISPTGPMFGVEPRKNNYPASGLVAEIEQQAMRGYEAYQDVLLKHRLEAARRALRVVVQDLKISPLGNGRVQFEFSLQSGAYATAVLRELINYA